MKGSTTHYVVLIACSSLCICLVFLHGEIEVIDKVNFDHPVKVLYTSPTVRLLWCFSPLLLRSDMWGVTLRLSTNNRNSNSCKSIYPVLSTAGYWCGLFSSWRGSFPFSWPQPVFSWLTALPWVFHISSGVRSGCECCDRKLQWNWSKEQEKRRNVNKESHWEEEMSSGSLAQLQKREKQTEGAGRLGKLQPLSHIG